MYHGRMQLESQEKCIGTTLARMMVYHISTKRQGQRSGMNCAKNSEKDTDIKPDVTSLAYLKQLEQRMKDEPEQFTKWYLHNSGGITYEKYLKKRRISDE